MDQSNPACFSISGGDSVVRLTVAQAAQQFLQWTGLKPHSTNGLPGHPLSDEIWAERIDFVFKGDRGSAEVTLTRNVSDERSIMVECMINREDSSPTLFEERSCVELGDKIRERIDPTLFDHAACFRIQGTDISAPTPWDVIRIFFDSVHIEEEHDPLDALHEVDIEALEPIRAGQEWLSRRSEELVDIFEEGFEVEFAHAMIPEEGLLGDHDRPKAIEILFSALQQISSLFVAREVVASRCYGQDEVLVILISALEA